MHLGPLNVWLAIVEDGVHKEATTLADVGLHDESVVEYKSLFIWPWSTPARAERTLAEIAGFENALFISDSLLEQYVSKYLLP